MHIFCSDCDGMPLKVLYQHAIYINLFFEILSSSKLAAKKEVLNIS